MAKYTMIIPDMMCAHCEKRVRDAVAGSGTVESLDLETKKVVVDTPLTKEELIALINDAGYDAEVM